MPPHARHWSRGSYRLLFGGGVVTADHSWSSPEVQTSTPTGMKALALACSTFPLHTFFPFLGALSAMKQVSACFSLRCMTGIVLIQGFFAVEMDSLLGFNLLE